MQLSSAQHVLTHPQSSPWMQRIGRVGYAVKGLVYAIMGLLALGVALGAGGKLAGEHEAVEHVGHQPFGQVALVIIGVGLLGYALWRIIEGVMDTHHAGKGWRGFWRRGTAIASGLINGAVGVAALQLALGEATGDHDPRTLSATLMREPWGIAALVLTGAVVAGVGIYHLYAGVTDRFTEHLQLSGLSSKQRSWALWSGRVGFVARGLVFSIIGVALVQAAINANPNEAKGFKEALQYFAAQPFGQALLIAVASGLLAYGIHLITTVPYRRLIG